jgi:hypothetical protein
MENTMFAYALMNLSNLLERAYQRRVEAYLAQSTDLTDLEFRMHTLERQGF